MADLSITAANVDLLSGSERQGTFGATVTAGQAVYKDTADNNDLKLAQADGTALEATVAGIALNGGADGQPGDYQTAGVIDIGATATEGEIYVLSQTAGGICPEADIVTEDDYVTIIGVGNSDGNISLNIHVSGAQIPGA